MTLWPYPTTACGESRLIWKSQAASRTPNEVLDFWESAVPSDWGWNARFGPVEDRRNNRRWKTEETIVGLPHLLVLSAFSRSDSPDLVAVTFHLPCHLSPSDLILQIWWLSPFTFPVTFHLPCHLSPSQKSLVGSNPIPSACRPPSSRILKRMPGEGAFSVNTPPDPVHVPLREGLVQDLLRTLPKPHIPWFTVRSQAEWV